MSDFLLNYVKELLIVDDFYNLIHRHNINYFFMAKVDKFIGKNLQKGGDELIKDTIWVNIEDAIKLYEDNIALPIIKIVNNRELPVIKFVKSKI